MMPEYTGDQRSRKRGRESNDESAHQGFQAHRTKRQITSLPLRQSPELKKRILPTFQTTHITPQSTTFADITPIESDSDDIRFANERRSFFLPWSSPPDLATQSSQLWNGLGDSQAAYMSDTQAYSDDLEMTDSGLLYPGSFQSDHSNSVASRMLTPINSQFSSHLRTGEKTDQKMITLDNDGYQGVGRTAYGNTRRLPSPISEDEATSPSFLLQGLGNVQMEVEIPSDALIQEWKATPKKGHTRSKHSLRNWGGFGSELPGEGTRRGFSMGYNDDCEKCRMKVPGHFSHVITY